MSKVVLLPHNEVGYDELTECLKSNQVATLNRATGTGKSFIGLKYAYENRNKRILIIAPTYPILDQWTEDHMEDLGISRSEFTKLDTMIYANLLKINNMDKLAAEYDIIILDEYHRCGSQKWGKKVRELKEAVLKYQNKKIIGLTATEIRYLDKERNMKDILFDGVEASRLSLADAILQGILPAPYYVSFDFETLEIIDSLLKRINSGLPYYCEEKKAILTRLVQIKEQLVRELFEDKGVRNYINKGEKYLAFSSTKEDIKTDRQKIARIFANTPYQEFSVHSGYTKEHNKIELEKFRNGKSDLASILYSIAILNEGVHVKDVSGIFMFRKTTSPIIYFQQLGRLLSFSRRKDRVYVFDYAGNLKNHRVIYNLYSEVCERAKELIKSDPKNKSRYESILENFKIVDKSTEILEKIKEYSDKYSKEQLIKMRLESDMNLLDKGSSLSYMQSYQIESDIRRFYKYVDKDLFIRIKNCKKIKKPNLFELSLEEFVNLLNGHKTIYDLIHNKYKLSFEKMREYIDKNYSIPSLFSEDEDEVLLAIELYNNYKKYASSDMKFIKNTLDDNTSFFERISYGIYDENIDYDELISEIETVIELKQIISTNIINALKASILMNKCGDVKKMSSTIKKIENYNKKLLLMQMSTDFDEQNFSSYVTSITGENSPLMSKTIQELELEIEKNGIEKVIEATYKQIEKFIKRYGYVPTFKKTYALSTDENKLSSSLACKMNVLERAFEVYGYLDKIDNLVINVQTQAAEKITNNIIEFIKKNNGFLPSSKSKDFYEQNLADYLARIQRKKDSESYKRLLPFIEKFEDVKKDFLQDFKDGVYIGTDDDLLVLDRCEKIKEYLAPKELSMVQSGTRLKMIIDFMLKHNYELPCTCNNNDYETQLARSFNFMKKKLTPTQFNTLSKYLKEQDKYKELFLMKYKMFVEQNGKIPRVIADGEEGELARSLNRWEPYIEKEIIISLKQDSIIKCIVKFLEENNYEYPSQRNRGYECGLAFEYSRIKNKLTEKNKAILDNYSIKVENSKKEFLEKLKKFAEENGCMPSISTDDKLYESYNRWLPFLTSDERNVVRIEEIQKKFIDYFIKNNYEYPSAKNKSYEEQSMAKLYVYNRDLLDALLLQYSEQIEKSKQDFIERYSKFVEVNKRLPLLTESSEAELIYSYNRWQPLLTKAELKKLEIKNVSKFDAMANAYQMMKQKRK